MCRRVDKIKLKTNEAIQNGISMAVLCSPGQSNETKPPANEK